MGETVREKGEEELIGEETGQGDADNSTVAVV